MNIFTGNSACYSSRLCPATIRVRKRNPWQESGSPPQSGGPREIRTSGSTSGRWKRSMAGLVRHRQTKEPETDRPHLNHRATSRLYSFRLLGPALLPATDFFATHESTISVAGPAVYAAKRGIIHHFPRNRPLVVNNSARE